MRHSKRMAWITAALVALPTSLILPGKASAQLATDEDAYELKLLGKSVFFDNISTPGNKQGCHSCHEPKRGFTFPDSNVNKKQVVAPGAAPHAVGNIKTPTNSYASFSPPFRKQTQNPFVSPWEGGNFWDGRAEGCGKVQDHCPIGLGPTKSETITADSLKLPSAKQGYLTYLGPTADQALNPFPNSVEQNIREKNVCQRVKTAKYKDQYINAFGEKIDCGPNPKSEPAYSTSYKRIALALAAWQSSKDVNSFTSKRDTALGKIRQFPNPHLSEVENLGHDLFYGTTSKLNPTGKNAQCTTCHAGIPGQAGAGADPQGTHEKQLYTDNRYHNIGTPFNREIPGVGKGEKVGLQQHVCDSDRGCTPATNTARDNIGPGEFKTPTLRNASQGGGGNFIKAYAHNGWFKSLEQIVHFYNTRVSLRNHPDGKCEDAGLQDATASEAITHNCWPAPEFDEGVPPGNLVGDLKLSTVGPDGKYESSEEAAIVAYIKTLSDEFAPEPPR